MFTGIIEEIGIVQKVMKQGRGARLYVHAKRVLEDIKLGDSISTNGICLTVVEFTKDIFVVDVMPETIDRSALKNINSGMAVNLERAMKLGDRFGGHIVTGHIDGCGKIKSFIKDANATWVTIGASDHLMKYIIEKGSIAIDGISLTVAKVRENDFQVSVIPMTGMETTLLKKKVGDEINLECDMIGKYIERLSQFNKEQKGVSEDFLRKNGFM